MVRVKMQRGSRGVVLQADGYQPGGGAPGIACECGHVYGERCTCIVRAGSDVTVEWMPEQHRASHEAARNRGSWPTNGSMHLRVTRTCANNILRDEGEWASEVQS